MWERVVEMLRSANTESPRFPPTVLYNENWMLRVVLDWLVEDRGSALPIKVAPGSRWYSEALLPSAFLARVRADPLAESYTHADGVIGHFSIGGNGKGDLVLASDASQFSVIEGKMFSRLSKGVRNARYFDQAARNVACMAEVLRLAGRPPSELSHLSFHVVAPASQIDLGLFEDLVTRESIERKVRRRVEEYEGGRDQWFEVSFLPTLERIEIGLVSWEELIQYAVETHEGTGRELERFYQQCVESNSAPVPVVK